MSCKIDSCTNQIMYKKAKLCQKHYFRFMRHGTYELTKIGKGNPRIVTPNGYVKILSIGHIFSDSGGYAYEHRVIFYGENKDKSLSCEFCGKFWNWRPYKDHVDHIDNNPLNNDISNLRSLCNACNTRRSRRPSYTDKNKLAVTFNGKTQTPEEWSREEFVMITAAGIRNRLKIGWSIERALTTPSQKRKTN